MNARRLQIMAQLVALTLGALAGVASAQQPSSAQADAIRQSCRSDYQAHCASVPTGGAAALQCLKENAASLSPGCQAAIGAVGGGAAANQPAATAPGSVAPPPPAPHPMTRREQAAIIRNACGGDFRRYCQGVRLGGGRAIACLADHSESLSPPCHEALMSARGAR